MNEENNKQSLNQSNIFGNNNINLGNNLNPINTGNNQGLNPQPIINNNVSNNENLSLNPNDTTQNIFDQPSVVNNNTFNNQETNTNLNNNPNLTNTENVQNLNPQPIINNNGLNNEIQTNNSNPHETTEPINNQNGIKPPNKKFNNKKIFMIVPTVVVISVVAIIALNILSKNSSTKNHSAQQIKNKLSNYERNEPISVPNNEGQYGFIDLEGNKVSDFIYEYASDFYNGYALVEKDNNKYIIDSNYKKVMDAAYGSVHNLDYSKWIINDKLYDENLKQISEYDNITSGLDLDNHLTFQSSSNCNCSGIMDYNGNIIYKEDGYINFDTSEYSNDYIVIEKDNQYAIISLVTGKKVLDYQNNEIESEDDNNFIMETNSGEKTLYLTDDKIVFEYNGEAEIDYSDEYNGILKIEADDDEYWKYFYIKTKEIFDSDDDIYEKYNLEKARDYLKSGGYYVFYKDGKSGIKKDGKIVVEAKYYSIEFPSEEDFLTAKQKNIEPVKLIIDDYETKKTIIYNLKNGETLFEIDKHYLMAPTDIDTPFVGLHEKVCNIFNKKCTESDGTTSSFITSYDNYVEVPFLDYNNYSYDTLDYAIYNKDMKKIYTYKKTIR